MIETFTWILLFAIISILCGGYIGWFLSGGSIIGTIVGIVIAASFLYGSMIYDCIIDW